MRSDGSLDIGRRSLRLRRIFDAPRLRAAVFLLDVQVGKRTFWQSELSVKYVENRLVDSKGLSDEGCNRIGHASVHGRRVSTVSMPGPSKHVVLGDVDKLNSVQSARGISSVRARSFVSAKSCELTYRLIPEVTRTRQTFPRRLARTSFSPPKAEPLSLHPCQTFQLRLHLHRDSLS